MHLSSIGYNPLLEQAAIWNAVLDEEDTPEHRAAFVKWVTQSPEHMEAFLTLSAALCAAQAIKAAAPYPLPHESAPASHSHLEMAVPTEISMPDVEIRSSLMQRLRPALFAVPAVCAALVLWLALPHANTIHPALILQTPKTAAQIPDQDIDSIGFYTLPDGSLMRVSYHTRTHVHTSADSAVVVTVVDGAAYFSGHHQKEGSLRVNSGRVGIEMIGTGFEVEARDDTTQVSVFEGQVRVSRCPPSSAILGVSEPQADFSSSTIVLRPNQAVRLRSDTCETIVKPTVATHLDLMQRNTSRGTWLAFDNTTVKVAAEMFNRVNTHCLILVDDAAGHIKIGGRFLSTDVNGFIRGLELLGVDVVRKSESPDGSIIYLSPSKR
jgi:ferric-dicitrate binding protein FerR (iron transport regulator)